MKKLNKKGFTIVELVIVIAVIAILAAVLIPTFASLVGKANMSSDEVTVRNMNTALSTVVPSPSTLGAAKDALDKAGFNTKKNLVPASKGHIFVWGEVEKAILLVKVADDNTKTIVYPEKYVGNQWDESKYFDLSSPLAEVIKLDAPTEPVEIMAAVVVGADGSFNIVTGNLPDDAIPECHYIFKTAEDMEMITSSMYANWYADFWVSFDKDLYCGAQLAGQYDSFGENWVIIDTSNGDPDTKEVIVSADQEIPLLGAFTGGGSNSGWTYLDIATTVKAFHCGAMNTNPNNEGTTMTVELRLTNPNDSSDYKIISICKHTF